MELRNYQKDAVKAIYDYCRAHRQDNAVCVLPTGAGKTLVISQICRDVSVRWHERVLVVTHQRELLEQAADKLRRFGLTDFGTYCAGLGESDASHAVTLASIQSVFNKPDVLTKNGPIRLVIVDEAHRIPNEGDGQYKMLFNAMRSENPKMRIIGMTATPYRMTSGYIYGEDKLFNAVCYDKPIKELIDEGYLCPLTSKCSVDNTPETDEIRIKHGEFDVRAVQTIFGDSEFVEKACRETSEKTKGRKRILVFCCTIEHAEQVAGILRGIEPDSGIYTVHSKMPDAERRERLSAFRDGERTLFNDRKQRERQILVNVDVLTTGFDCPDIDAVVLLRPTASTGLYVQMVGRGLRLSPSKKNCLVLDFGGNILRHGRLDAPTIQVKESGKKKSERKTEKVCQNPECGAVVSVGIKVCPCCGTLFAGRDVEHESRASDADIWNPEESGEWQNDEFTVRGTSYYLNEKVKEDGSISRTVKVRYNVGYKQNYNAFLCPEHYGYARKKFVQWWKTRTDLEPVDDAEQVVDMGNSGMLGTVEKIRVEKKPGDLYASVKETEVEKMTGLETADPAMIF